MIVARNNRRKEWSALTAKERGAVRINPTGKIQGSHLERRVLDGFALFR